MEASRLLLASVIKEKICAYLSFVDIVNLRNALGIPSLKVPISVTDSKSSKEIILPGVNSTTIRANGLIKQQGCDLAFIESVRYGDNEVVQTLINSRVDVNATDRYGWTALMVAAFNGQNKIVQTLLTVKDIDVNITSPDGTTALIAAYRYGRQEIIQCLQAAGSL